MGWAVIQWGLSLAAACLPGEERRRLRGAEAPLKLREEGHKQVTEGCGERRGPRAETEGTGTGEKAGEVRAQGRQSRREQQGQAGKAKRTQRRKGETERDKTGRPKASLREEAGEIHQKDHQEVRTEVGTETQGRQGKAGNDAGRAAGTDTQVYGDGRRTDPEW